jgi:hypothetical protein
MFRRNHGWVFCGIFLAEYRGNLIQEFHNGILENVPETDPAQSVQDLRVSGQN